LIFLTITEEAWADMAWGEPLDLPLLGSLLCSLSGDDRWAELEVALIAGGKSNLTFEVSSPAGAVILRRPPMGQLLPSAHDMSREARVQMALDETTIPVAKILYVDSSDELFGAPFYIMEKVNGHIIRGLLPPSYAQTDEEKTSLGNALVDVLADLHRLDPASIGLGDFGRAAGYLDRQIARWNAQWQATKTADVPAMDELIESIKRLIPDSARSSIVHGDFRLDNCVMATSEPSQVSAVLDWELSTLGDPMVDLAMFLFYWREPGDRPLALVPSATSELGFPTRDDLLRHYVDNSRIDPVGFGFYDAFARFKFAAITQGVLVRAANDVMAGQEFGDLSLEVNEIAEEGLEIIRRRT
jgi:aminoglycoside phosphotransferase (APT) family kinase protein